MSPFRPALFVLFLPIWCAFLHATPPSDLTWRLTAAPDTNNPGSRARLEWPSHTRFDLSAPTWSLRFNFPLAFQPLAPETGLLLHHVNGDVWEIAPLKTFKPGKSFALELAFEAAALNFSLGPNGAYFRPAAEQPVTPLTVSHTTPPASLLSRGPVDTMPAADASDRFQRNQKADGEAEVDVAGVFPTPKQQTLGAGFVNLGANTVIVYHPDFAAEARFLQNTLQQRFQHRASLKEGQTAKAGHILLRRLEKNTADSPRKREEGYQLRIAKGQPIEAAAHAPAGVFYALQSLLTLVPPAAYGGKADTLRLPEISVDDEPRFAYRGFHLDVARHFHGPESVRRTLDVMALYKLNRFHFHLTDDEGWRLAIKDYPELTNYGATRGTGPDDLLPSFGSGARDNDAGSGAYDRETFVSLLRYAAERHIEVIPEIDLPGHARAAIQAIEKRAQKGGDSATKPFEQVTNLRDPEDQSEYKSVQGWKDNVICVCRPDSYRFIESVITDLEAMYREAGLTLKVVHAGGDEVPKGAWLDSPACKTFMAKHGFTESKHLFAFFFEQLHAALTKRGVTLAGWEEIALLEDHGADDPNREFNPKLKQPPARTHVWNDIPGFGREALAYQLANNGFEVVLSSAAHLYFDLAYEKDYLEPGYYWAGYTDTFKVFRFSPHNVYAGGAFDRMGRPIDPAFYTRHERLSEAGSKRVIGIQGQLWSETVPNRERLEYMMLPKLFGLAERAWSPKPAWEMLPTSPGREQALFRDWRRFAHRLGQVELPRLDRLNGGYAYRLPPPGAVLRDGLVHANTAFPGLTIRYSTDGGAPTEQSPVYTKPFRATQSVRLAVFDQRGRGSRITTVTVPQEAEQKGAPTP
ncbi:beta-N-acetylhexosaminidase [Acanthopleuribacter pedis]|uniref:beta-N-acetylhexosaminidase n=1 Tax=Acanthopleuribacter pedis TaxID=442870 RepID=A0A8J7Q9G2_9BACT|nr:family 20 glycosylhydrolase [Acanthopleuribacter pedis]MBO1316826.1 family 20 glycosylhydrolase [Acanthopleuribacter pedis]